MGLFFCSFLLKYPVYLVFFVVYIMHIFICVFLGSVYFLFVLLPVIFPPLFLLFPPASCYPYLLYVLPGPPPSPGEDRLQVFLFFVSFLSLLCVRRFLQCLFFFNGNSTLAKVFLATTANC